MARKESCACNVAHHGPCEPHVIEGAMAYDKRPRRAATLDDVLAALDRIEDLLYRMACRAGVDWD